MQFTYKVPEDLLEYLNTIPEEVFNDMVTKYIQYSISKRGDLVTPVKQQAVIPDMTGILAEIKSLVETRQVTATEVPPKPLPKPKPKVVRPAIVTTPDGFGDKDDEIDFLSSIIK